MIDSKDLRIGNILFFPFNQENIEVVGLALKDNKLHIQSKNKDGHLFFLLPENLKYIKLTEDILLKCGFVKSKEFKLHDSFSFNGFLVNFVNDEFIEYVSRVKIKGLHHLQNIYYFRTEQELEIQL